MVLRAVLVGVLSVAVTPLAWAQDVTPPTEQPPAEEPSQETPPPKEEGGKSQEGKETPTPDDPGDIPRPKGYAPDTPQPFLTGPPLWLVQLTAGLGARTLFGSLAWVPLIGLVAMLAAPLAEAAAITFAGDRVGPYRSSLFWPVVVSYVVTAIGSTASFALWAMGVGIAVPGLMLMLAPGGVVGSLAYVGAGLLVGGALILVAGTVAWALSSVVSAAAALVAYQLNKSPKHADDNGTDFPRLLPRGKGFPLPFLRGGDEEGDSSEEDPPPGSTPVGAEVQP